jgi:hypothetical protein
MNLNRITSSKNKTRIGSDSSSSSSTASGNTSNNDAYISSSSSKKPPLPFGMGRNYSSWNRISFNDLFSSNSSHNQHSLSEISGTSGSKTSPYRTLPPVVTSSSLSSSASRPPLSGKPSSLLGSLESSKSRKLSEKSSNHGSDLYKSSHTSSTLKSSPVFFRRSDYLASKSLDESSKAKTSNLENFKSKLKLNASPSYSNTSSKSSLSDVSNINTSSKLATSNSAIAAAALSAECSGLRKYSSPSSNVQTGSTNFTRDKGISQSFSTKKKRFSPSFASSAFLNRKRHSIESLIEFCKKNFCLFLNKTGI